MKYKFVVQGTIKRGHYVLKKLLQFRSDHIQERQPRSSKYAAIIKDELLTHLSQKLTAKHYSDIDRHEHVRCKICERGRFLVDLTKSHRIYYCIVYAILPTHFQKLLSSAQQHPMMRKLYLIWQCSHIWTPIILWCCYWYCFMVRTASVSLGHKTQLTN